MVDNQQIGKNARMHRGHALWTMLSSFNDMINQCVRSFVSSSSFSILLTHQPFLSSYFFFFSSFSSHCDMFKRRMRASVVNLPSCLSIVLTEQTNFRLYSVVFFSSYSYHNCVRRTTCCVAIVVVVVVVVTVFVVISARLHRLLIISFIFNLLIRFRSVTRRVHFWINRRCRQQMEQVLYESTLRSLNVIQ